MLSPELFISLLYTLLSVTMVTTDTPGQLVLTPDDDCVYIVLLLPVNI